MPDPPVTVPFSHLSLDGKLATIFDSLAHIQIQLRSLQMTEADNLATAQATLAAVQAESTLVGSVDTLLTSIKGLLDQALADAALTPETKAALDQIAAIVASDSAAVTAAIAANTPAAAVAP